MLSMTGYGRCLLARDGREMAIEVKAVNHRFLDVNFRIPRNLSFLEDSIRCILGEQFSRGHIDIFISYHNSRADARVVSVDESLLSAYRNAYQQIEAVTALQNDVTLTTLAQIQDVLLVTEQEEDHEAVLSLLRHVLRTACEDVRQMRQREGASMAQDLSARLGQLDILRMQIAQRAPQVVCEYRDRLQARIAELLQAPPDPQRMAQEVAMFADRAAIDEELVRLESHIAQIRTALTSQEPIGRRLDFLVQELNREINTIGSKASDIQITHCVVAAKCEIEKLREQVQNIE